MSTVCEIVEELVVATSACPATDIIAVQVASAQSASTALLGLTQPLLDGTAVATSQATVDAYAIMVSAANAAETASPSIIVTGVLTNTANGRSITTAFFNETALASADAADEIVLADAPQLLISVAQSISSLLANTVADFEAADSAAAESTVSFGLFEFATSSGAASTALTLLRRVDQVATSSAAGTDEAVASGEPEAFLLLSTGESTSSVFLQSNLSVLAEAAADLLSDVWYKDPDRVAWVMNTETTAASWYDNFDFESIVQAQGKVLAVGPDGLYELVGATDSGEQIDAEVVSGFTDFGTPQTKHVDTMYFGYTSEGRISVTVETYESGHAPATYVLEQRDAVAPRNSRVTPGKGLWGRYWRMTIRNVDGADFEVHDATAEIAVSSRRV